MHPDVYKTGRRQSNLLIEKDFQAALEKEVTR